MKHEISRIVMTGAFLLGLCILLNFNPERALAQTCSGETMQETLPTNGKWELCWDARAEEGIVLTNIFYTTPDNVRRKVLKEASIAQIHSPFDDNSARYHYVTNPGLGGAQLVPLTSGNCPNGTLLQHNGASVLCKMVEDRGYIYKYESNSRQGYYLTLFSVSKMNGQHFIVRWRFYDDGSIEPSIGSTGIVSRRSADARYGWRMQNSNDIGVGYVNNYYWRLDFDLGANGANDLLEEFNVASTNSGSNKSLSVTAITSESGRSVDAQKKRSWRVRDGSIKNSDGHAISYHLEPMQAGNRYVGPSSEPWTANDLFATKYRSCERFASQNPTTDGCGADVSQFTNGENINGADLVLWYRISYHHLPRAEYQPYIPVHWDGFVLMPRDWTATSPIAN